VVEPQGTSTDAPDRNRPAEEEKAEAKAADEVSLEELIKKYNGSRISDRYSVTPVTKEQQASKGSRAVRMRSVSCQRPASESERRVSGSGAAEAPLPATAAPGKFSSMKELLKNVVRCRFRESPFLAVKVDF
jgi:hypothetical protein